jgi:UDP-GlcNAc3NAcA epimerase
MKIISVVGTRPEFIQAAPVSRILRQRHHEIWLHTGQHYGAQMSHAILDDLGIPTPSYNLHVGSGSHAQQTGRSLLRLEEILLAERPDVVLVRGDTNSTLAGALAASKLRIPLAHIEAGERSHNRCMPEEINRIVTDQLADIHFCASRHAVERLNEEGLTKSVHWVGDVMLDAMLQNRQIAHRRSQILARLRLAPGKYSLVTVHRQANVDDQVRLRQIIQILNEVQETIVFPVHPRTAKALVNLGSCIGHHVQLILPVSYFDMIVLEESARLIATDSGGVQREAYFLGIPCLTLRDETEWVETVETGWNKVVGTDPVVVLHEWEAFTPSDERPPIFGDGNAAHRIVKILEECVETDVRSQPREKSVEEVSHVQKAQVAK